MNENLISVANRLIGGVAVQTVNARDLHAFLEVRKDFSDWIKAQLSDIFTQTIDFEVFPQKGEPGSRPRVEYAITIECAKHIAMMSRTAKGREVRDYFIALEREYVTQHQSLVALPNFSDPVAAARAWADEVEAKQTAQLALEQAKPAVEFVEKYVEAATGDKTFRQVCKLLGANENRFREFLVEKSIVYYLNGEMTPFAQHLDAVRFSVKAGVSNHSDHAYNHTRFTAKGVTWIAGEWGKHFLELNQRVAQQRADPVHSHARH